MVFFVWLSLIISLIFIGFSTSASPMSFYDWFVDYFFSLERLVAVGIFLLWLYGFFWHEKVWSLHRVILVLLVGIIEGVILYKYWLDIVNHFRMDSEGEIPAWLGSLITTLVVAPIAFCIWFFRDADKKKELQHAEENIRQADFHKIQEWATIFSPVTAHEAELAAKEKLAAVEAITNKFKTWISVDNSHLAKSEPDKIQGGALQVAAIYQLLPYLKGEYGERFVRPAMEIYRSLLAAWQWGEAERTLARKSEGYKITKPAYIIAIHTIFLQEAAFFRAFHDSSVCKESHWIPLRGIDLKGVNLFLIHFEGIDFSGADLSGADLREARLVRAHLEGADLRWTRLAGADLRLAYLEGANLAGADLRGATFDQKAIDRAITDETTQFGEAP